MELGGTAMKSWVGGITSLVLLIMAASSLLLMFFLTRIDGIIHGDLYRYGLQFDAQWALPYWTLIASMFGIGWFNIIVALTLQFYLFVTGRREARITSRREKALKLEMPTIPKPIREEKVEIREIETKKLKLKHKKKVGARKHRKKKTTSTKAKTGRKKSL